MAEGAIQEVWEGEVVRGCTITRHLFTVELSALNLKNEFTEGNVAVEGWVIRIQAREDAGVK